MDNHFIVYHQNIRGLKNKINELLISLSEEMPRVLCLTEQHLEDYELLNMHIPKFKLGAEYCRKSLKQGGVCIYVHESLKYTNINLQKFCNEQNIELAVIQLKTQKGKKIIICIYRTPTGNFESFINNLEATLSSVYKNTTEFIICRNSNINYLEPNDKKDKPNNLLNTYNLIDIVTFPTRIGNNSATLIDNIFIDNRSNYTITPCTNGLSDHEGLVLTLIMDNVNLKNNRMNYIHARIYNNNAIAEFQLQLSYEYWDDVFGKNCVNEIFNNFLNN